MWLFLTLTACLFFAAGAALQKHGMATAFPKLTFSRLRSELGPVLRAIVHNWVWLLGLLSNLAGGGLFVLAVDQGEVSVVQPLVNLNLLLAMLLGVFVLGERLRGTEWAGAGVMALGAALVLWSAHGAPSAAEVPSRADLWALGITVAGYGLALALALLRGVLRLSAELAYAVCAGVLFGLATVHIKLASVHVAAAGGVEALALGDLLLTVLRDPAAWALVPDNVVGFVLFQLAFANGRVAVVSPVTNIAAMVLPVVAGALAFGEAVGGLRLVGVLVVGLGMGVILRPAAR